MCDPTDDDFRTMILQMTSPPAASDYVYREMATFIKRRLLSMPYVRLVVVLSVEETELVVPVHSATSRRGSRWSGGIMNLLWLSAELKAVALLSLELERRGIISCGLDVHEAGVKIATNLDGCDGIIKVDARNLQMALAEHFAIVVPGSFGSIGDGTIANIGRGGGELTANVIAAGLGAFRCEVIGAR